MGHGKSSDGRNQGEERKKRAIQEAEGEDKGSFAGDNEEYSDDEDRSVSEAEVNADLTILEDAQTTSPP